MKPHSQKFLQKRRLIMAIPVLVLPFLTMIFWALGGGQGSPVQAMSIEKTGLNLQLPDAHFGNEEWNKLALYDKAQRDSLKFQEEQANDPYFNLASLDEQATQEDQELLGKQKGQSTSRSFQNAAPGKKNEVIDPNQVKVNQKLDQLYRELNKTQETTIDSRKETTITPNTSDPQFSTDVQKL